MSNPLFSVIVATYARPDLLAEALRSVLEQTERDFECIVVDDCGPLPGVVPDDPRFRLVRRESNGGFAASLNTGLSLAKGKYVTFLDDDDLYTPDRLALATEGLNRAPVAICWERYLHETIGGGRVLEGDVSDTILDHLTPSLGTVAIKRDVVPRFDETFLAAQDVEWWLRVTQTQPLATVPKIGYVVRKHSGPRNLNGLEARISYNKMLLETHSQYFKTHPKAAAFRWKRIGLIGYSLGRFDLARGAFLKSLRIRVEARNFWHLLRSIRTSSSPRVSALVRTESHEPSR